jgi:tRNA threonylcarbamoyladenosine biosynthesis protein TsaE
MNFSHCPHLPECCASIKHVRQSAMPEQRLTLPDEAATATLARRIALRARSGDLLLLTGPLGAGKTTFARAFIRARAGDAALEIPSPTFTLVQTYDLPTAIWHYDLWRLSGTAALEELGWDEAQSGIVVVEWPDRLSPLIFPHALHIAISPVAEGREITLRGEERWLDAS